VLSFAGIHLIRFTHALQQWDFLAGLLTVSPLYLALSGLVWLVVGLVVAWALWLGCRWAPRAAIAACLAFSLYYWLDRLLLAVGKAGYNWLFSALTNLFLLVIVGWILYNHRAKTFFGDVHDR